MGMQAVYMLADKATMDKLSDDELFENIEDYGDEETTETCDIDKMWDGLHFLLTGASAENPIEGNPLSEAVVGEKAFDCDDFIAYTEPSRISSIVDALDKVDIEALIAQMDFSKFKQAEIYPNIWENEDEEEEIKDDLKESFLRLRAFYQQALDGQTGVIATIY